MTLFDDLDVKDLLSKNFPDWMVRVDALSTMHIRKIHKIDLIDLFFARDVYKLDKINRLVKDIAFLNKENRCLHSEIVHLKREIRKLEEVNLLG